MKKNLNKIIILAFALFTLGYGISCFVPNEQHLVSEANAKTETAQKVTIDTTATPVTVDSLDLIKNPNKYVGKRVKITGAFDKFSILGLDYKPAMKSSENYIGFLIQRPNVDHDIPLSELKNFLSRKTAEKFIDLNNGDIIEYTGTVFSSALGDAWVDVDKLTVIEKKKTEDKK